MKWFKHMSDSGSDESMMAIRDELGMEGVGIYWSIIEMIASKFDGETVPTYSISPRNLSRNLGIYSTKLKKFCDLATNLGLFECNFIEGKLNFVCHKLLEIKDNHTRNLQATDKKVSLEEEQKKKKNRTEQKNTKKQRRSSQANSDFDGEFLSVWKDLPKNARSMRAQSVEGYRACRREGHSHDDIIAAWMEKVAITGDSRFLPGMQVFLKPMNIQDFRDRMDSGEMRPATEEEFAISEHKRILEGMKRDDERERELGIERKPDMFSEKPGEDNGEECSKLSDAEIFALWEEKCITR